MRNYTSKSQKIEIYSKKYNKTEEEMYRILTEHEALLTKDELGIKYDNSHIGELPQWLVDEGGYEVLEKCIETGIKSKFDYRWATWTDIEELTSYMWEFTLKRIHLFKTKGHIITAVKNRMVWLWREHFGRSVYFGVSFQDPYGKNDEGNTCTYGDITPNQLESLDEGEVNVREFILSIPDEKTRSLLIAVAYLMLDMQGFKKDFYKIVNTTEDEEIKTSLIELADMVMRDIEQSNITDNKIINKLKIRDIIKAMQYNVQGLGIIDLDEHNKSYELTDKMGVTEAINQLKDYIVNLGLATYPVERKTDKKKGRKFSFYEEEKPEEPIAVSDVVVTHISDRPDLQEKYKDVYDTYLNKLPVVV